MDMDNRVGIDCGSEGWAGQWRAIGKNRDNCNRKMGTTTIKGRNSKKKRKEKEIKISLV